MLDSITTLKDYGSIYESNRAQQGGVVFAINDSQFQFTKSSFHSNLGNDGAVMYGMYNFSPQALSFSECSFVKNFADQNLMQLMSSQALVEHSTFTDNSATQVNHGITMITSQIEFYNSTVSFSDGFAETLDLSKLDCGFFNLFLSSTIRIGRNTEIRNLRALNQAVLSAFSLSSVYVEDEVRFINNTAISSSGITISLQNTDLVVISDAHFDGNYQTNILI